MTSRHLLMAATELMLGVVSDARKQTMGLKGIRSYPETGKNFDLKEKLYEKAVLHVHRDLEYSFVNFHHRMPHGEPASAGRIHQKQPQSREACPI